MPLIALPTTAGTGAEATKNAVIGIPEHRRKVSLRDDRMLPDLALVDPALTDDCPPGVTLASGLDAVTQVIEPYLSCRANPLTDALCRDAIPRGLNALRSLMDTPTSKARDQMAYVSLSGGIALANAGLGAVHGLAGVLGGRTGMAHGAICGRLLVPILHANAAALHAAGQPAERITEIRNWVAAAFDTTPDDALAHLSDWADSHGLPYLPRVSAAELQDWAQECERASSYKANPIPLGQDRLIRALEQALPPG